MKKTLAIIMTFAMLFSMFAVFSVSAADEITISPYDPDNLKGFENWGTPKQTQLLVCTTSDVPMDYTWELTFDDGTTSKTISVKATSDYADWLRRFEVCCYEGENQFIPTKGTEYTVSAKIYDTDGNLAFTAAEATGFYCGFDPIVPGADEPELTWPETMKVAPKFVAGGVENWRGSTWFLLGPTFTNEPMADVATKLYDGTYTTTFVITNETTGAVYTISKYAYDHNDLTTWAEPNGVSEWKKTEVDAANTLFRLCASDYGVPVVAGETYTITGTIKEGDTVKYVIESAQGAYAPIADKLSPAAGPAEGFVPPHSYDVDTPVEPPVEPEGPKEIELSSFNGGWENWENSPNKGDYPSVTQLLIVAPFDSSEEGATAYTWKLTIGDKTIELVPASNYDFGNGSAIWRFETCFAEGDNQFIPVAGESYVVSAEIYNGDELVYVAEAGEGASWDVPADLVPVLPTVDPVDPPVDPVDPPATGDATVVAIVFAVVALMGMGVVVTKKVRA